MNSVVEAELERERGDEEIAPVRLASDDLEPDTRRTVIESLASREGIDDRVDEGSLEAKVARVPIRLRRGEAPLTFDPTAASVDAVMTSAIGGCGRLCRRSRPRSRSGW